MSHEANLYCKTCDKLDDETDFKYRDNDLIQIIILFKKLRIRNKEIMDSNIYTYNWSIDWYPNLLDFVNDHYDHELYVRSECYPEYQDIKIQGD